jgi:ligand-binding sensor domain-containing protein
LNNVRHSARRNALRILQRKYLMKRFSSLCIFIVLTANWLNAQNFWQEINTGLTELSVRGIAVGDSGYIFSATASGVFRSSNNGTTWSHLANSGSITVQSIAYDHSGYLYAGTEHGMYLSTDNGITWSPINTGFPDTLVLSIAINASGQVFAGTDLAGLFRSTNHGSSWTPLTNGLTSDDVAALAITSTGVIYAGTDGQGMFRSTDNGNSWRQLNNGMTDPLIRALAVNTSDSVFAGTNTDGMFRLLNADTTWVQINSGITTTFMASLGIQSNGTIYAGTSGAGVFRSTNNGNSWAAVNAGLTDLFIDAIAFDADGYVYAGSSIGGDFRSIQPVTAVQELRTNAPATFSLGQNFPNPFNPTTVIQYSVQGSQHVGLKIFDVLGREVMTLVNEVKPVGQYAIPWDATGVPSGVYYYRLTTGHDMQVRKLVLAK